MKNLKYLQLFEAFESQKLSKTLKFINNSARSTFMQNLSKISSRFDFPISKFSDEMFEYLPFKSALKKNVTPKELEREVCGRESDWIPGEFCQGGRVKRTWGAHTRMVDCPGCRGTGFKSSKVVAQPEVSLLKFWFDKDGNFINVTGCDGQIRPQNKTITDNYTGSRLYEFSKNLEDYNQIRELSLSEIVELPTGTIVLLFARDNETSVVSMVFHAIRYGNECAYMLQDEFGGASPDELGLIPTDELKKYADFSWCIIRSTDFHKVILLEPKVKSEVKLLPEEEGYTWNNLIDIRYMRMSDVKDMEDRLKNAHFAIILDLNKLKEGDFKKVSLTKSERELRKAGAFLKPEDVKEANIDRYMSLIVKKFDANKGLSELTKVLPRAFGYTNILVFTLKSYNVNNLDSLVTNLNSFMRNPNDYTLSQISSDLGRVYDSARERSQNINRIIDSVWKLLDKSTGDQSLDEKAKKYFQTYLETSEMLYRKVASEKIETLTDIELVMNKLKSIRQFTENTRFETLRKNVRYISDYLGGGSYPSYVTSYIQEAVEDHSNAQGELEELKKVIEKTF